MFVLSTYNYNDQRNATMYVHVYAHTCSHMHTWAKNIHLSGTENATLHSRAFHSVHISATQVHVNLVWPARPIPLSYLVMLRFIVEGKGLANSYSIPGAAPAQCGLAQLVLSRL